MPSSVIRDFDYDAESEELTIEFTTSRIYVYFAVPPDVFATLCAVRSKGGYFNRYIRDRYDFREVTPA
jgi:hypothetical protein